MTAASLFDQMSLEQLEEASGELHRRAGAALRRIGEARADDADPEGTDPRRRVAMLSVAIELAITTLAAAAAGVAAPTARLEEHPTAVAALMYGTPTLRAQLDRLEQDRRILASLARHLESRLDETRSTAWGELRLRDVFVRHAIAEPARCAQLLEATVDRIEADEAPLI